MLGEVLARHSFHSTKVQSLMKWLFDEERDFTLASHSGSLTEINELIIRTLRSRARVPRGGTSESGGIHTFPFIRGYTHLPIAQAHIRKLVEGIQLGYLDLTSVSLNGRMSHSSAS